MDTGSSPVVTSRAGLSCRPSGVTRSLDFPARHSGGLRFANPLHLFCGREGSKEKRIGADNLCGPEDCQNRRALDDCRRLDRHALGAVVPFVCCGATIGIPDWLKPDVGKAKVKSRKWSCRGRARSTCKKFARARSEIPVTSPWTPRVPTIWAAARWGCGFTSSVNRAESFRAISAGHGGGRDFKGIADFGNGKGARRTLAMRWILYLMTGGAYVTGETKTSFKGYYRISANHDAVLIRSFVQFDGEGETANARQREIGGHAAALLRNVCLRKDPHSSYADRDGYVPFGQLEEYANGSSDGCTSWSRPEAGQIVAMMKDNPTTLYIYPEEPTSTRSRDAVKAGRSLSSAGLYWNASCLKEIGAPKFWPKETLEPVLAQYKRIIRHRRNGPRRFARRSDVACSPDERSESGYLSAHGQISAQSGRRRHLFLHAGGIPYFFSKCHLQSDAEGAAVRQEEHVSGVP